MKKTYNNPTLEVVVIATQNKMLAGSNYSTSDFGGETGGTNGKTITVDGRGFDFDED